MSVLSMTVATTTTGIRFERWGQRDGIYIRHRVGDKVTLLQAGSRSRGSTWHQMDLEAYGLNGRCDCENFQFQHEPLVRRMQRPRVNDEITPHRCKHLEVARELLLNIFLSKLATPPGQSRYNEHP